MNYVLPSQMAVFLCDGYVTGRRFLRVNRLQPNQESVFLFDGYLMLRVPQGSDCLIECLKALFLFDGYLTDACYNVKLLLSTSLSPRP
ncbi:hypothetical protein IQ277_29265 [Nostocales cyanobacterium LEGE 12452]|nr:hypothetical protein [Nostocales cyanobacterium LEGE 12452]